MTRHSRSPRFVSCFPIVATLLYVSCGWGPVRRVEYSVRPSAVGPLGSNVIDRSKAFAETFCATLSHTDNGKWGDCGRYLEARVPQGPHLSSPITSTLKVLLVGGAFSECFENHRIFLFGESVEHLQTHGVVFGPRLSVGGTTTPEENARAIAEYLRRNPGDYLAIGHSKGAVDLMTAIQHHEIAQSSIKALVSVAGAIAGSRLADLGVSLGIAGFRDAVRRSGLGNCDIVDKGGIGSLRRDVRYQALRDWTPPETLHSYSLVAVSSYENTSAPLRTMWRRTSFYSIDQDSHIIAEESLIPGAEFLGIVNADHWAIALPLSEHPATVKKVDRNAFPRTALLESIVRYVDASMTTTVE